MPPAARRMSTPAMVSEIAKSACVTCRVQPPSWMRFGALLNDAQNIGMFPTSVGGGDCADGNWLAIARFCGPGSATLAGLPLALMAPCGGSSGLPKDAASVVVAAVARPLAAVAVSMLRLEIIFRASGLVTVSLPRPSPLGPCRLREYAS